MSQDKFMNKNNIYKILRELEWKEAQESGQIITDLDNQDGFIHLSTASQLAATLAFFFKDSDYLQLLQLDLDKIDVKTDIILHTRLWKLILVSEIVFFSGCGVDSNRI